MQISPQAAGRGGRFACRVYRGAAIYGVLALFPAYFVPVPDPWHLTHLGFVGVALGFQWVFWIIGGDPLRFRPLMPITLWEKLCFGIPAVIFAARAQVPPVSGVFGAIDLLLATLFFIAWRRTPNTA